MKEPGQEEPPIKHPYPEGPEAAIERLGAALAKKPNDVAGWLLLSDLHAAEGDHNLALVCMDKAVAIRPNDARLWSKKADIEAYIWRSDGNSDDDLLFSSLKKATELDPLCPEYWNRLAGRYSVGHLNEEALEASLRAVALEPENANYWFKLGCIQSDEELPDEAENSFERAVKLDPSHAYAWFRLGSTSWYGVDMAFQAYQHAAESASNDPALLRKVGMEISDLGFDFEARRYFREALDLAVALEDKFEQRDCRRELGHLLAQTGEDDLEARSMLLDALDAALDERGVIRDLVSVHARLKAEEVRRKAEWSHIQKQIATPERQRRYAIARGKRLHAKESSACPECHRPPRDLRWIFYRPPGWETRDLPNAAWMTICEACERRVDYFPIPYVHAARSHKR